MADIDPAAIGGPHAERRRGTALHSNDPADTDTGTNSDKLTKTLMALRNKSHAGLDLRDQIDAIKEAHGGEDLDAKEVDTETLAKAITGLKRRALMGADLSAQIQALEEIHEAAGGEPISDPGFIPQEGNGMPVSTGHSRTDGKQGRQHDDVLATAKQQQAALIRDPARKAESNKPMGRTAEHRNEFLEGQRGVGSRQDPNKATAGTDTQGKSDNKAASPDSEQARRRSGGK